MERRQSRVRKMLNAANLRCLDVYSLRKEKAAKEEVGAEAAPRRLAGWAVRDPRASRPQPRSALGAPQHHEATAIASPSASSRGPPETERAGGPLGAAAHTWQLFCASGQRLVPHPLWSPQVRGWGLGSRPGGSGCGSARAVWLRCRPRIPRGAGKEPPARVARRALNL